MENLQSCSSFSSNALLIFSIAHTNKAFGFNNDWMSKTELMYALAFRPENSFGVNEKLLNDGLMTR